MQKKNPLEVDLRELPLNITRLSELKNPLKFVPPLTYSGFKKEIVENYTCIICQEVYINPVVTNCRCKITLCNDCFNRSNKRCPICRSYTSASENHEIKSILEKQEFVCECKMKYKYGCKEDHLIDCDLAKFVCHKCEKPFSGPQLRKHLLAVHPVEILMYFGKISIV